MRSDRWTAACLPLLLLAGCLDYPVQVPTPGVGAAASGSIVYGGQTYKTVTVGSQTWMAQNLNHSGSAGTTGKCYENNASNCARYGRLYTWAEIMGGSTSSTSVPSGVKGICPDGWHVPSDAEWSVLLAVAGGQAHAANALKSSSGWESGTAGSDYYGFGALPAGNRSAGLFYDLGLTGGWWSASANSDAKVWVVKMNSSGSGYVEHSAYAVSGTVSLSLRCLQDR